MRVFTVFVHPNRQSLVGAILDRFLAGIEEAGYSADLSDLYRDGFNPVLGADNFDFFRERG